MLPGSKLKVSLRLVVLKSHVLDEVGIGSVTPVLERYIHRRIVEFKTSLRYIVLDSHPREVQLHKICYKAHRVLQKIATDTTLQSVFLCYVNPTSST